MPIFHFSEGFFFSIELTYVLFVIKDTQGGKKPSARRLFKYTHTKGHDDQTFVDQRSRATNVSFIKIKLLLFFFLR